MLMSLLNNLNNSNKLQLDSSETTKLVPVSNQDISLVEPKKKCKLRKLLIILLLIIGSGLATYVHIYSLIYGWKQITKVATLIGQRVLNRWSKLSEQKSRFFQKRKFKKSILLKNDGDIGFI